MSRVKKQTTRLFLERLESREVPAVFNIADGDVTALNNAIVTANGNNQDDTINLATNGTYTTSTAASPDATFGDTGFTTVTADGGFSLTINGNGSVLERASTGAPPAFRVFRVSEGTLILNNVTVRGGLSGSLGGGIRVDGATNGGSLTMYNSTVSNNGSSFGGGGIGVRDTSDLTLVNVTVTNNNTVGGAGAGGAIYSGFAGTSSSIDLSNVTIANNISFTNNVASGVVIAGGTALISNSVIANNTTGGGTGVTDASQVGGTTVTRDFSLVRNPSGTFGTGTGNLASGTDPLLGALGNNGGSTQTMLPQTGSPLINAGSNADFNDLSGIIGGSGITTDQRGTGFVRVGGSIIDIGAVEIQTTPPVVSTTTTVTSSGNPSLFRQPVTFTATVTPASGGPATGTVTFRLSGEPLANVALVNGTATFTTTALPLGSNLISAVYNPTGSFSTSTSTNVTQVVNARTTSIALSAPPTLPANTPVNIGFTVSVAGPSAPIPTGFATLFVDGVPVSTVRVTGNTGNFVVTLGIGARTLQVQFVPDGGFLGSTSSPVVVQAVSTTPSGLPSLPNTERVIGRRWRR